MKVFLSHPMSGLSEEEVMKIREEALLYLQNKYNKPFEAIDNYHHENVPENAGRLWHLAESIKQMEEADYIYFCPNWEDALGCRVERLITTVYELPILK